MQLNLENSETGLPIENEVIEELSEDHEEERKTQTDFKAGVQQAVKPAS